MKVAMGIDMLEISAVVMGKPNVIHPTLIQDDQHAILVDTGFPGQLPLFREAFALERLTQIVVTHQDIDHIGGLPAILADVPQKIEVLASEAEKPYIQGDKRWLKITPEVVERAVSALPPDTPPEKRAAFRFALENPPKAPVDRTIADGERLPACGGISVIITPGHTPGHVCLYHHPTKTLVAGDALRVADGRLLGPEPGATLDLAQGLASLKKLAPYDIQAVICYHGGLYTRDVNRRIAELAES